MATVTVATPKKTHQINAGVVAADIAKFGATGVAILEAVMNTAPGVTVPTGWQAVLSSVLGVLVSVQAVLKNKTTTATPGTALVTTK